jgi:hypothetical protein
MPGYGLKFIILGLGLLGAIGYELRLLGIRVLIPIGRYFYKLFRPTINETKDN